MKARGKFIFKELQAKDGGSFTNAQGQVINYDSKYVLKVDERTDKGIHELTFKLPKDSAIVPELKKLEEYTEVTLDFDIIMSQNSTRIVPISISNK